MKFKSVLFVFLFILSNLASQGQTYSNSERVELNQRDLHTLSGVTISSWGLYVLPRPSPEDIPDAQKRFGSDKIILNRYEVSNISKNGGRAPSSGKNIARAAAYSKDRISTIEDMDLKKFVNEISEHNKNIVSSSKSSRMTTKSLKGKGIGLKLLKRMVGPILVIKLVADSFEHFYSKGNNTYNQLDYADLDLNSVKKNSFKDVPVNL